MEGRGFYFRAEPTGNHIWHLWRGDLDKKEWKVEWVWKDHQILSLGGPGQGAFQCLLFGWLLFHTWNWGTFSVLGIWRVWPGLSWTACFLSMEWGMSGAVVKDLMKEGSFFYLLKEQESGMGWAPTSGCPLPCCSAASLMWQATCLCQNSIMETQEWQNNGFRHLSFNSLLHSEWSSPIACRMSLRGQVHPSWAFRHTDAYPQTL